MPDPLRSRLLLGVGLAALGALLDLGAGAPVRAAPFYALTGGWLLASWAFFRRGRDTRGPLRSLFFWAEVATALAAGWLLGASPWLGVVLVLFPVTERNLLRPGPAGLAAGAVAGAAAGVPVGGIATAGAPAPGASGETGWAAAAAGIVASSLLATALGGLAGAFGRPGRRGAAGPDDGGGGEGARSHRELREAYEELRSAQAELVGQAKLATLGQLVAGVAHEINTPLGALSSNHDTTRRALDKLQVILEDEKVTADELDEVRRIVRAVDGVQKTSAMAVERMQHLVKNLRSFGRPDRSEVDRVDLHEGIDSTLEIVAHELGGRVEVVRDYGELPPVTCLPHQLNQVFMNLVLNAGQAIEGEGTITIATRHRPEERAVEVRVSDTGSGIAPEHQERIFGPGFTTKGSRMGMGLGLLITRQIVDRHGGRIEVESAEGEGTTFTVVVPVELPEGAVPDSGDRTRVDGRGARAC